MELNEKIIMKLNSKDYLKYRKDIKSFYIQKKREELYSNTPIEFIPNKYLNKKERARKAYKLKKTNNVEKLNISRINHAEINEFLNDYENKDITIYINKYGHYLFFIDKQWILKIDNKKIEFKSFIEIRKYYRKLYKDDKIKFVHIKQL